MNRYLRDNVFLGLLLLGVMLFSLIFGRVDMSLADVWQGLTGGKDNPVSIIVRELRLPRVILGAVVGAALGLSGAALQGMLRNPLADPGVIGVTASAAFGAVLAIHLGFIISFPLMISFFAMAGALVATAILLFISARDASVLMLILVGLGISSLATALISLVMNLSESPISVRDMIMWMLGSLENRTVSDLWFALPFIGFGWLLMLNVGQGLNALSVGEDTAKTMGVNIKQLKLRIVVGSAISVGAAVAVCGSIGFVGLIVPHMVRGLICNEPGPLLLPSALMGALLLTFADILTRVPTPGAPLHIGVVMALVGAPAFLFIVYKTRENMR
ncbi:iron ABC transporter permease [Kordiimonas sp. SCSIO 12603]|uniref:FecCD family ABC transporter permease n=1 Tax=Kordiimonas sp. SCSIO 12603 TaxID=2829596 RepID=UPI0021054442|nr:iron ABC transporter permease [Kordiimonas sp. SCSIO 12603]UTW57421.1 iron ABC transporter permease [Kordiimonas sp. SCSIO 12603]